MIDSSALKRANKIIEHLCLLDDEVSNAQAFLVLLKTLHSQDLSMVPSTHVAGVEMVRAGILRAAISSILACLDPHDERNNRASIGQILKMLDDDEIKKVLLKKRVGQDQKLALLDNVKIEFAKLIASDPYKKLRKLRNNKIGHNLLDKKPGQEIEYSEIYDCFDSAKRMAANLLRFSDCDKPKFESIQSLSCNDAQMFWGTYFKGLSDVR